MSSNGQRTHSNVHTHTNANTAPFRVVNNTKTRFGYCVAIEENIELVALGWKTTTWFLSFIYPHFVHYVYYRPLSDALAACVFAFGFIHITFDDLFTRNRSIMDRDDEAIHDFSMAFFVACHSVAGCFSRGISIHTFIIIIYYSFLY